jgi:hypothetical protein
MSGIGSIISTWSAGQRVDGPAAEEKRIFGRGAPSFSPFPEQAPSAEPNDGGHAANCSCARLLTPASMAAVIGAQIQSTARASVCDIFAAQALESARPGAGVAQSLFTMLDVDAGGVLNRSEFDAALSEGVSVAADNDGQVVSGEGGVDRIYASSSDEAAGAAVEGDETFTQDATTTSDTADAVELASTTNATKGGENILVRNAVTTTQVVNPDDSTSTMIIYPDGTTATLTTPANPVGTRSEQVVRNRFRTFSLC